MRNKQKDKLSDRKKENYTFGKQVEEKARAWFLNRKGVVFLAQNYRCRLGEIDLVFEESLPNSCALVFIEVRARRLGNWQSPSESINQKRAYRIKASIQHFLSSYRGNADHTRIDLLAWDGCTWEHFPNFVIF